MFPGLSKVYLVRVMCETCQSYAVQHYSSDAQQISSHHCEKVLVFFNRKITHYTTVTACLPKIQPMKVSKSYQHHKLSHFISQKEYVKLVMMLTLLSVTAGSRHIACKRVSLRKMHLPPFY